MIILYNGPEGGGGGGGGVGRHVTNCGIKHTMSFSTIKSADDACINVH